MSPIELGKFIASLRNEKNLTQEELAEKLYIDKRKISRWECGNSIPEFEMLIKLSEILDVSLYELSICKRIENETLTRKTINQFKSIKDFKKFNFKKKIKIIILIIFFILFIITATYTIKNNGTVEIYKIESLDDNYILNGDYIHAEGFNLFYIRQVVDKINNKSDNFSLFINCEYEIYDNGQRKVYITGKSKTSNNLLMQNTFYEAKYQNKLGEIVNVKINCDNNSENNKAYSFNAKLTKIYDNNLF